MRFLTRHIAIAAILFSSPVLFAIDYRGLPEWEIHSEGDTEYVLYRPQSIPQGRRIPIVLFMHGCCGDDDHVSLRNAVAPPLRMWHSFASNIQKEPTYLISPATSRGWQQHFDNLIAVIDDLVDNQNGDPQRIYVSGFSMGGRGSWRILNQYPNKFAAAIIMGMDFDGEHEVVSHVPTWSIRGETDWWCRNLPENIAQLRKLNGDDRGALDTATGVNPRYTDFKGKGHGIMWETATQLEVVDWAYSKVNDGNQYPNVFFATPATGSVFAHGDSASLEVNAEDPDGRIARVELWRNGKREAIIQEPPYTFSFTVRSGDQIVEARAIDEKGKFSVAKIVLQGDSLPQFRSQDLIESNAGEALEFTLEARGNAPIRYKLAENAAPLPNWLTLSEDGELLGYPEDPGTFQLKVLALDAQGDATTQLLKIVVKERPADGIVVDDWNQPIEVSRVRLGNRLHQGASNEVNFSEIGPYQDLLLMRTSNETRNDNGSSYLRFQVDRKTEVLVAYEKMDYAETSTTPPWLESFSKLDDEIVAQYRYYDVYSKEFDEGRITLPGANAEANGVETNYFVMLRPASE